MWSIIEIFLVAPAFLAALWFFGWFAEAVIGSGLNDMRRPEEKQKEGKE